MGPTLPSRATDDVAGSLMAVATASAALAGQRRVWAGLDAFALLAELEADDDAEAGHE